MGKEWYEANEWSEASADYNVSVEDVTPTGCEVFSPEKEFAEITEQIEWEAPKTERTDKEERESSHKKRLRKTLYGVASMAMVVSLASSIANTEIVNTVSRQGVHFNLYDRYENYAKGGIIIVGGCDTIGGVGHVPQQNRYVDYNGNQLELDTSRSIGYNGKWVNSNGYVLVDTDGNDVYTLFDKNGHIVYEWKDADYPGSNMEVAAISDNNTVFIQREVKTDNGRAIWNSYYTVSGKGLYTAEFSGSIAYNGMAEYGTPFRDGLAVCNDETGILLIHENGDVERLVEWDAVNEEKNIKKRFDVGRDGLINGSDGAYELRNVPCVISGNVSEGYFLVTDTAGNFALVDVATGEMYKTELDYGDSDVDSMNDSRYVEYTDNEGDMIHFGARMCRVEENAAGERKYYLYDVIKHCDENGKRIGYLACYDAIYFEDYPYLVAREGNEYCYIDLDGNKVSENFKKASTFNEFGYALVWTQEGRFYVIDSAFNKLEQIRKIDDFEIKDLGEVFWVTRNGEPYSYYYGPEIRNK